MRGPPPPGGEGDRRAFEYEGATTEEWDIVTWGVKAGGGAGEEEVANAAVLRGRRRGEEAGNDARAAQHEES